MAERVASLAYAQRKELLQSLSDAEHEALLYDYRFWARKKQLPPAGNWHGWLIVTGRGFGKNWTGAGWVNEIASLGHCPRIGLIARTSADVRDTMIEGESGVLTLASPMFRPEYKPAIRRLVWPNGVRATTFSADEPDALRGPGHDALWGDELASWRYRAAWDNAMLGLRKGASQWLATTTPKKTPLMRELIQEAADKQNGIVLVRGTTYENYVNLSENYKKRIVKKYEHTRLAGQELRGEDMEDDPRALWTRESIERDRVHIMPSDLLLITVGVDPMGSDESESSEAGIVAAGIDGAGHVYIKRDASCHGKPEEWGRAVVAVYTLEHANDVTAETNYGGDMVVTVLHSIKDSAAGLNGSLVPVRKVTASRNKRVRAEPVAMLYDQRRVHHVGFFPELEDEMCTHVFGEGKSPNRLDALVWAVTRLVPELDPKHLQYGRDYGIA